MFTGIVEEVGTLRRLRFGEKSAMLGVAAARVLEGTRVGDSVLTDGCCLTVTAVEAGGFTADLQPETVRRTTFARRAAGDRVNLERALTLESRLGGHLVSGDVDGVGVVKQVRREANAVVVDVAAPPAVLGLCAAQGRITVDGVGLTIVGIAADTVRLSLIPHTMAATTLHSISVGREVNLEADLIARYVHAFVDGRLPAAGLTWQKLAEAGF
jgi:riboflavin synthase